jgi:hypothetical protein
MITNTIVPNIWFSKEGGSISKIIEYYKNIFGNNLEPGQIIPLGETPSGKTEMCDVIIFSQKYVFMNTEKEHNLLNDSLFYPLL